MKHLMQSDIVFVTLALIVTIAALIFAFMVIAVLITLLGNLAHDTGKPGMGSSCAYFQHCYAPAGDLAYWDHVLPVSSSSSQFAFLRPSHG